MFDLCYLPITDTLTRSDPGTVAAGKATGNEVLNDGVCLRSINTGMLNSSGVPSGCKWNHTSMLNKEYQLLAFYCIKTSYLFKMRIESINQCWLRMFLFNTYFNFHSNSLDTCYIYIYILIVNKFHVNNEWTDDY